MFTFHNETTDNTWLQLYVEIKITVSVLEKQIAKLQEEVTRLKLQKPKMSISDIIDDTEKVSYINVDILVNIDFTTCSISVLVMKHVIMLN